MRGYDADRAPLLDVLTAVAAGYGKGPASAPAWLRFDVNKALAEGIVERYETGDRSPGPDRSIHRAQVRSMVDANLSLLGLADGTSDDERDVLTMICLGSWGARHDDERGTRRHPVVRHPLVSRRALSSDVGFWAARAIGRAHDGGGELAGIRPAWRRARGSRPRAPARGRRPGVGGERDHRDVAAGARRAGAQRASSA